MPKIREEPALSNVEGTGHHTFEVIQRLGRPPKERKDGAFSREMVHVKLIKGGPLSPLLGVNLRSLTQWRPRQHWRSRRDR
jgi:hypothetical protein